MNPLQGLFLGGPPGRWSIDTSSEPLSTSFLAPGPSSTVHDRFFSLFTEEGKNVKRDGLETFCKEPCYNTDLPCAQAPANGGD